MRWCAALCRVPRPACLPAQYETDRFWQAVSGYVEFHRQALTPQMLQDLAYAWALRKQVDNTLYNVRRAGLREACTARLRGGLRSAAAVA